VIYRNVWLVETGHVHVDKWGTFVTTPVITEQSAKVDIKTTIRNTQNKSNLVTLVTTVYDAFLKEVSKSVSQFQVAPAGSYAASQEIIVSDPKLWSVTTPYLYKAVTHVECDGKICDNYETNFGIRSFEFHSDKGFSLNGKPLKILGVCNHHDLGCLGSAVNIRAIERQLEILKTMGCNGIRTSHNPPAPELLDLCDKMGFIVMNEAFDMWKKKKSKFDYSLYWDEWHERDLGDFVLRDRNHPSVFIWSIGNEILEQWDSTGTAIAKELTSIVKSLDPSRPVTVGCNDPKPHNFILQSGVIDLIGYNYHHQNFLNFHNDFPGKKFIATETTSALATRGEYDMPSDSIRRWPLRWDKPFTTGNPDLTCSAYDNCSTPWGSTHEETWKVMKKQDYLSGMFVWTGFDYLGEPTPYSWPARSSYFGIIDLAGFPKDAYYMYQSEWTKTPVLHIFPHWNWTPGDTVDIWAYFNSAEMELFLNEKSLGTKAKKSNDLHVSWRIPFEPGTLRAISRTNGREILRKEIRTAGKPAGIMVEPDRSTLTANGKDLSFIKVWVIDADGNLVPDADNLIEFSIDGEGTIIGVDNGDPVSHESFKAKSRKAMNGLCLAVIQPTSKSGIIRFTAHSEGLQPGETVIRTQ
jgi:beta-galactosidase